MLSLLLLTALPTSAAGALTELELTPTDRREQFADEKLQEGACYAAVVSGVITRIYDKSRYSRTDAVYQTDANQNFKDNTTLQFVLEGADDWRLVSSDRKEHTAEFRFLGTGDYFSAYLTDDSWTHEFDGHLLLTLTPCDEAAEAPDPVDAGGPPPEAPRAPRAAPPPTPPGPLAMLDTLSPLGVGVIVFLTLFAGVLVGVKVGARLARRK